MPEETPNASRNEFPLLNGIAIVHLVIGVLLVVAGGILLVVDGLPALQDVMAGYKGGEHSWIPALGLLGLGIATYTFGELIQLFLQIEKNTRR